MIKLKLGKYVFQIPEENSMEKKVPFWIAWIAWIPGLDNNSREASIVINERELLSAIPNYQAADVNTYGTLAVLTDEEVRRYKDPNHFWDEWTGQGSYQGRRVEPWGNTGWYKVFHPVERHSWTVMRQYPDPAKSLPNDPLDFYVARCSEREGEAKIPVDCRTYAFFDDIALEFHLSEANLLLIDQVRAFLKTKVLEWKQQ